MTRTDGICLGTLGDRSGVNVAKVEVSWYCESESGLRGDDKIETGYYIVHATGDEPECQGEDGTIYNVFEGLVHARMSEKVEKGWYDGYEIEDVSSY